MKVAPPTEKSANESPIISFILLERYNAIRLVQTVHQSLAALSKVIRGTQLLNKDVQNLAAALLNQEVRLDSKTSHSKKTPKYVFKTSSRLMH